MISLGEFNQLPSQRSIELKLSSGPTIRCDLITRDSEHPALMNVSGTAEDGDGNITEFCLGLRREDIESIESSHGAQEYRICLGNYERILFELASIIDSSYLPGEFSKIEDVFSGSHNESDREWELIGTRGRLRILLEPHEGYFFGWFKADEPWFEAGRKLLYEEYLREAGNPAAQDPP